MGYSLFMRTNDVNDGIEYIFEGSVGPVCDIITKIDPDWRFLFYVSQPEEAEELVWSYEQRNIDAEQFLRDERGEFATYDRDFSKMDVVAAVFSSACDKQALHDSRFRDGYDAAVNYEQWYEGELPETHKAYLYCAGSGLRKMADIVADHGNSWNGAGYLYQMLCKDGRNPIVDQESEHTYSVYFLAEKE